MATWGSQTWGFANWGTLGDTDAPTSGISLTASQGNINAIPSIGWGALFWGAGEWGELANPEGAVSGNALSLSLASVSAGTNFVFNATGLALQSSVGDEVSGISQLIIPTGLQATSNTDGVFGGELVTVEVTSASNEAWGANAWGVGGWGVGDGNTISIGDEVARAGAGATPSGSQATVTAANVVAGISVLVIPTGQQSTSNTDGVFGGELVTVEVTSPSNDEWGTEFWGAGQWGVGDGITVLLGAESTQGDANVQVSGSALSGSIGTTEIPVVIDTGIAMSSSVGSAFGGELVTVEVRTASAQPWGNAPWGEGQWGQSVGTDISQGGEEVAVPSVEVDVTGQQLTSNTGNESITGDANITLTGVSSSVQLGNEDAFTNVNINITGNSIGTIVIGDHLAGISQLIVPTPVTMTAATGIMGLNAWEIVDSGPSPTWTVVDKAA